MKNQYHSPLYTIVPLLLANGLLWSASLEGNPLLFEGFETDGLGLRYTATDTFNDGVDDYFMRTDGSTEATGIPAYSNWGGAYFWAAEDTDATDNPSGLAILDFSGISLGEFPEFQISLDIGAGSQAAFDSVDDFVLVQYRIDAGPWNTALAFQNDGTTFNSSLLQDTDFDGIGDGILLDVSLQTISSPLIPVTGSFLDLRIDTLMTGGSEAVAFDNIQVTGVPEPAHATLLLGAIACLLLMVRRTFLPWRENESQA